MLKVRDDNADDVKVVKESKTKAKPRTKAKMKFGNKNKKKGKKKQSPDDSVVARLLAMPRFWVSIPTGSRIFHPKITTCKLF